METNENAGHGYLASKKHDQLIQPAGGSNSGPDGMLLIEDGYKTSTNHEPSDGVVHHNEIQLNFNMEQARGVVQNSKITQGSIPTQQNREMLYRMTTNGQGNKRANQVLTAGI